VGRAVIRVLVADDHPMFVRAISTLLAGEDDIEVVATAASGAEAVRASLQHRPDVVLMDLHMPDLNGIEATRQLTEAAPDVGVLVLTMFDDDDSVAAALRVGARGYLLKGARQEEVARAIRSVHAGDLIIGRQLARRMGALLSDQSAGAPLPFPELTDRERDVLDQVARGLDNTSIGRQLFISEKTVRNYVSTVFAKLHVTTRSEAIVAARTAGLGK
jgi:DNA-binding NarL/FixJ family response regulator